MKASYSSGVLFVKFSLRLPRGTWPATDALHWPLREEGVYKASSLLVRDITLWGCLRLPTPIFSSLHSKPFFLCGQGAVTRSDRATAMGRKEEGQWIETSVDMHGRHGQLT